MQKPFNTVTVDKPLVFITHYSHAMFSKHFKKQTDLIFIATF